MYSEYTKSALSNNYEYFEIMLHNIILFSITIINLARCTYDVNIMLLVSFFKF